MAKIDIIAPASNKLAPLYGKYEGNSEPGRAYMVLLPSGKVHFEVTMDRTHTFDVHYGREWIWYIPPEMTRRELEAFGAKTKKLLSLVLRGLRISRDINNYEERGTLTPKGKEASDKIQAECDRLFELVDAHEMGIYVYEPDEYFEGESPEDYDLDNNSSDDEIKAEATHLLNHLNSNNQMINGDLFHFMREWVKNYNYD